MLFAFIIPLIASISSYESEGGLVADDTPDPLTEDCEYSMKFNNAQTFTNDYNLGGHTLLISGNYQYKTANVVKFMSKVQSTTYNGTVVLSEDSELEISNSSSSAGNKLVISNEVTF